MPRGAEDTNSKFSYYKPETISDDTKVVTRLKKKMEQDIADIKSAVGNFEKHNSNTQTYSSAVNKTLMLPATMPQQVLQQ